LSPPSRKSFQLPLSHSFTSHWFGWFSYWWSRICHLKLRTT
jgi:hypothetical protein